MHGRPQATSISGHHLYLYPIFHPAAALYTPAMLTTLKEDFLRLPELLARAAPQAGAPASSPEAVPAASASRGVPKSRVRKRPKRRRPSRSSSASSRWSSSPLLPRRRPGGSPAFWRALLEPPGLVTIEGDLGTGKTTLVREIMRARGVRGPVTSPSFTLAQSYRGRQGEVLHHLDLYRLRRGVDADLFAWDDYLGGDDLTFVEWPAAGRETLAAADVRLELFHRTPRSRLARLHASATFEQAVAEDAAAGGIRVGDSAESGPMTVARRASS